MSRLRIPVQLLHAPRARQRSKRREEKHAVVFDQLKASSVLHDAKTGAADKDRVFLDPSQLNADESSIRQFARAHGLAGVDIDHVREHFQRFDNDDSGFIDQKEFVQLVTALLSSALSEKDVQQLPKKWLASLWSMVDGDGSGSVNFEEFANFYIKYFARGTSQTLRIVDCVMHPGISGVDSKVEAMYAVERAKAKALKIRATTAG